jgi:hypothetical protein
LADWRDEFEGAFKSFDCDGRPISDGRNKALAIEDALHQEQVIYTALTPNQFKDFRWE